MVSFRLVTLVSILGAAHGFGNQHQRAAECGRRDALLTGLISASSSLLIAPLSSNAAVDLSSYKDGPNGLKYLVTKEAPTTDAAVKPQRAQKVKTSYTLYLNGFPDDTPDTSKQVDSSKGFLGDKPFEFNVGVSQVIKGWDLSLLDMKEGEARRLVIPSDLGYGDKGAGGKIPGGSTLYFEVELTEIGKLPTLKEEQLKWLEDHPL